jgi:hypothetical protein
MSQNVETLYRVHKSFEGVYLEIGDIIDASEYLELRTTRKEDKAWFGDLTLTLDPAFAIQLGNALISAGYNKLAQLKAEKA